MTATRTRAIILRRTNYGEADRILQLLTPEGKQNVIARGARREKSKLAGGIELFAVSDVVITRGKSDLDILTSARLVHFYRHIIEDYDTLQIGYAILKHITKASEMINEPEWYHVLSEVFAALDVKTIPSQLVEMWFYLHYAVLLGYELSFITDINGQPLRASECYSYDVAERGLRPNPKGIITSDHIKFMRLVNAKPLKAIAQIGGIESILAECFLVARQHAAL